MLQGFLFMSQTPRLLSHFALFIESEVNIFVAIIFTGKTFAFTGRKMILAGKAFCSASAGYIFEPRMKEVGYERKKHPPGNRQQYTKPLICTHPERQLSVLFSLRCSLM